jgi:hypothetical protein
MNSALQLLSKQNRAAIAAKDHQFYMPRLPKAWQGRPWRCVKFRPDHPPPALGHAAAGHRLQYNLHKHSAPSNGRDSECFSYQRLQSILSLARKRPSPKDEQCLFQSVPIQTGLLNYLASDWMRRHVFSATKSHGSSVFLAFSSSVAKPLLRTTRALTCVWIFANPFRFCLHHLGEVILLKLALGRIGVILCPYRDALCILSPNLHAKLWGFRGRPVASPSFWNLDLFWIGLRACNQLAMYTIGQP